MLANGTTRLELEKFTVLNQLGYRDWATAGDVCRLLRECGELAFRTRGEHDAFHAAPPDAQRYAVSRVLENEWQWGRIDMTLGNGIFRKGEFRTFRLIGGN